MFQSTYFIQECPTCGRRLQIRVEYLGRRVVCQHCHGALIATDPILHRHCVNSCNPLLRCAEELLATVSQRQTHSRVSHPR